MRKEEINDMLNFFFQAEDGIRDKLVTGVQTCALPIFMTLIFAPLILAGEDGFSNADTLCNPLN